MRRLLDLLKRLVRRDEGSVRRAPGAVVGLRRASSYPAPSSDLRVAERVTIGQASELVLHGSTRLPCQIADASRSGMRLRVPRSLPENTLAGATMRFNGKAVKVNMRVVWSRRDADGYEIGATFIPNPAQDAAISKHLVPYLRWRSAFSAA